MKNTRLKITVLMMVFWFVLGMYGLSLNVNMKILAMFCTPPFMGLMSYIWGETKRGSHVTNPNE